MLSIVPRPQRETAPYRAQLPETVCEAHQDVRGSARSHHECDELPAVTPAQFLRGERSLRHGRVQLADGRRKDR
jgi:hypothetical protein